MRRLRALAILSVVGCGFGGAAGAAQVPGLLLHASFDGEGYEDMEPVTDHYAHPGTRGQYPNADFAVGDPVPTNSAFVFYEEMGKFGGAAKVQGIRKQIKSWADEGSILAFDAVGNILARRGTMAFWARLEDPLWTASHYLVMVRDVQWTGRWPGTTFLRLQVRADRKRLELRSSDRSRREINLVWSPEQEWPVGSWHHFAIVWDAAMGRRLYHNGRLVAERWDGTQDHRSPALDQIALGCMCGPEWQEKQLVGWSFDELYVFDHLLDEQQIHRLMTDNEPPAQRNPATDELQAARDRWVRDHFSLDAENIPDLDSGTVLEARQAYVDKALAVRIDTRLPMDGKVHTVWPLEYHGYSFGGKQLRLQFDEPAQFNYLRARGSLKGTLTADGQAVAELPGAPFVQRLTLDEPVKAQLATLQREEGIINELDLFSLGHYAEFMHSGRSYAVSPAPSLEGLGETGRRIAAYYPPEDCTALLAREEVAETGLSVERCRLHHIVTEPMGEDTAIEKIILWLTVQGFAEPTTMLVQVHDAVTYTRDCYEFDVRFPACPDGPQSLTLSLDCHDILLEKGKRLWLSLVFDQSGELLCGPAQTRFVLQGGGDRSLRQHVAEQESMLTDLFELLSEPRRWCSRRGNPRHQFKGTGELMTICEHILHFDPDNQTAAAVYSWILRYRSMWDPQVAAQYTDPLADVTPDVPGATGPGWAVYGCDALKRLRAHCDFWANERQADNGELGSYYGDDTDLVNEFVNFSLISDPGDRLKNGLRKLADYTWETTLTDGISKKARDHLHTYEEGTNIQSSLALLYYGNPEYIERLMAASRYYDGHITAINAAGHRHFRSHSFSATTINEHPREAIDAGMCYVLQPGRFLVWYNGSAEVLRVLSEWQDAWLDHAADKPTTFYFGDAIEFATDASAGKRARCSGMFEHLYFLYGMTGDERYREPVIKNLRAGIVPHAFSVYQWAEWRKLAPDEQADEGVRKILTPEEGEQPGGDAYLRWRLGEDRSVFIEALKADLLHMKKYLPMHTWVGQSADRVSIPQSNMARMFLGGMASRAKQLQYHFHAVSWEGADDDIARFVLDNSPAGLKALIYSFHDEPQQIVMRVWQLNHGRYRVRAGADADGDEKLDAAALDEEMELARYSPLKLTVPPRQTLVVEVEQLQRLDDIRTRPDLAVGPNDVTLADGKLTVTVHNIGGGEAPASKLRLLRGEQVVAEKPVPALPAPLDLQPRTAIIEFGATENATDLRIVLDPDNEIGEITEANNVLDTVGSG